MVSKAIQYMKNERVSESEGISAELLMNGLEKVIKMLTQLIETYKNITENSTICILDQESVKDG